MAVLEVGNDMVSVVYRFIKEFMEKEGFSPTHREICDACFISRGSAVRCLDMLMARGVITRQPNVARSIRLLDVDAKTDENDQTQDCL